MSETILRSFTLPPRGQITECTNEIEPSLETQALERFGLLSIKITTNRFNTYWIVSNLTDQAISITFRRTQPPISSL